MMHTNDTNSQPRSLL